MTNHFLPTTFLDSFENGLSADLWEVVKGGWISQECGSLAPHGGGKHLYMGECGMREIVTKELDTSVARYFINLVMDILCLLFAYKLNVPL